MRRTVFRDSFSARLMSRRLRFCACRVRTASRIAVGIMVKAPSEVILKPGEDGAQAAQPLGEFVALEHLRQRWVQSADECLQVAQVTFPLCFRSGAHVAVGADFVGGGEAFDEQARLRHQTVANAAG